MQTKLNGLAKAILEEQEGGVQQRTVTALKSELPRPLSLPPVLLLLFVPSTILTRPSLPIPASPAPDGLQEAAERIDELEAGLSKAADKKQKELCRPRDHAGGLLLLLRMLPLTRSRPVLYDSLHQQNQQGGRRPLLSPPVP